MQEDFINDPNPWPLRIQALGGALPHCRCTLASGRAVSAQTEQRSKKSPESFSFPCHMHENKPRSA